MTIFIFGNPDLPEDSLPLRIIPNLKKHFPEFKFETKDPHEEWDLPNPLVIIDTAHGIASVQIYHDLQSFEPSPNISLHDFDAYANLRLLEKLGKLPPLSIIAVSPKLTEDKATRKVSEALSTLFHHLK